MRITSAALASPPVSAATAIRTCGGKGMKLSWCRTARHAAAATAAPPETPMKLGSASGLRKTAWKLQPEIARPPPMPIAATRRGRRRLNNTLCCAGLSVGRSDERRVGKECVVRVDLVGRRIIKKKNKHKTNK